AGRIDDVVDQDAVGVLDVADHVHDLADAGLLAALIDDGEVGVNSLGDGTSAHHAADIGRHHGQIAVGEGFLDVLAEHRAGVEVVDGDVEKALNLRGMQVEGENAAGAGIGDQ